MIQLTSSEKAVVNYINGSGERYNTIYSIESTTIVVDERTLTQDEIASTI